MCGIADMGFELDPKWIFPSLTDGQKKHWQKKIAWQYFIALMPVLFALACCIFVVRFNDPGNYAIVAVAAFAASLFLLGFTRYKTLKLREFVWRDLAAKEVLAKDQGIDPSLCHLVRLMVAVSGYPKTPGGKEKLEDHFRKCSQCSAPGAFQHDLMTGASLTNEIKEELEQHFGPCEFKQ